MKKTVSIIFAVLLCFAIFACENEDYLGEYRTVDNETGMRIIYVLKLEKGGKCKSYILPEGATEDTLVEGINIFTGTYKVKGDTITFYFKDIEGNDETTTGTILANGNIKMFSLGAMRTYKKRK